MVRAGCLKRGLRAFMLRLYMIRPVERGKLNENKYYPAGVNPTPFGVGDSAINIYDVLVIKEIWSKLLPKTVFVDIIGIILIDRSFLQENTLGQIEKFVHDLVFHYRASLRFAQYMLGFNQDKYWRRVAISKTGLKTGERALDVACGTGRLTVELAKQVGMDGKVVGLDFCRSMLDIAVEHIVQTPYGPIIELVEGNAMALPFADDSFDSVATAFAFRNVSDIAVVLAEMLRVVRPGGTVISLELAKPGAIGFKQLYYLYFEKILPLLGRLGIGVDGPYNWLPQSLRLFPHQAELCAMFRHVGFKDATYYELTGGIVAVHVGIK